MFKNLLRRIKYQKRSSLYWARGDIRNWGDDLNPWLFNKLTRRLPIYCPHQDVPRLLMAGSILERSGPHDACWGTGFISEFQEKPPTLKIAHALRGPLSRDVLLRNGIEAASIYGDPGLLASDWVPCSNIKKFSRGVIPHYVDHDQGSLLCKEINANLISVSLGIEEFVLRISEADIIFSSSLHGIICAESLGIPAVWVRFSDNLIGGDFKFHDYIAGTDRLVKKIHAWDLRRDGLTKLFLDGIFQLPDFDLATVKHRLMESFPLKTN